MVDQIFNEAARDSYRSLSADSELQSAYEYLRKGDFKLCKRTIDKKLPKLKSEIDKVNFNIVKVLLLNKLKKPKDEKKLIESLKKEILESPSLTSNTELCSYFKNVLRELNEEGAANEIFKHSIKNYNLAKIPRNDQFMILKELTVNYEFGDLYSKINSFLKNENDPDVKFLTLLKYEIIYILAFKYEKFSKTIVNLTLKEMLNNYATLSTEKGFIDILVKYLLGMNDTTNFLNLFENKKNQFTNAPMDDLIIDIYFKKDDSLKLVNYLINSIINNLNECNFGNYQRLVNYVFYHFEKNNQLSKIDNQIISNFKNEFSGHNNLFFESYKIEKLEDINSVLSSLLYFFDSIISKVDKKTNFNAYKSSSITTLIILHNLVLYTKNYSIYKEHIYNIIMDILDYSINKQSILTEISKFFIYLDSDNRKEILSKYSCNFSSILSDEEKEKIIFSIKLEKMLNNSQTCLNSILTKINYLVSLYFSTTKNIIKLEKGDRILGDDIIILINEYFFEFVNNNPDLNLQDEDLIKLVFAIYSFNSIASERSPYNYDISLFYLRIASFLNLPSKVLEILKFMNLKGPQFETVSYIAFPCFVNNFYKPGLVFLIESFAKWENSNKKSIRKTFWKMFTGRNFWNTEELLLFLQENENSYFKHVLNYCDVMLSYNDNSIHTYEDESQRKENFNDITDLLICNYSKYEKQLDNGRLTKSQDLLISIFKFKNIEFFNKNFDLLKRNINFTNGNYKYKIDSLWKNSIIYENYPGFKSNYFKQSDTQVFGIFEEERFLKLRMSSKIIFSSLNENTPNKTNIKENLENYYIALKNNETIKNDPIFSEFELISKNLLEIYLNASSNIDNLVKEEENLEQNYSLLKDFFVTKTEEYRSNYNILNFYSQQLFNKHFQFFKMFYLPTFTLITSKLVDLVNNNKKVLKDAGALKTKLTNYFKSPMMNTLVENASYLDGTLKKLNSSDTFEFFLKSISILNLNGDITEYLNSNIDIIEELATSFHDEQKDVLKSLVETSKVFKNFVKDNI